MIFRCNRSLGKCILETKRTLNNVVTCLALPGSYLQSKLRNKLFCTSFTCDVFFQMIPQNVRNFNTKKHSCSLEIFFRFIRRLYFKLLFALFGFASLSFASGLYCFAQWRNFSPRKTAAYSRCKRTIFRFISPSQTNGAKIRWMEVIFIF
jgi:hypothetical protein